MVQKKWTEREKREHVAYQFELQASKYGLHIVKRLTNYRFLLLDTYSQKELVGMVLPMSWSFYEYRLNKSRQRVHLAIVQRHNAVVPISVLEMTTGVEYDAGAVPEIERAQRVRRNPEEVHLFISKLLVGLQGVYDELDTMPRRTRQRYLALRDEYLKPRVGRPWAS